MPAQVEIIVCGSLRMKVLIVDDEPGTRLLTAAVVERLGHRALQAGDGSEALERFAAERPEVVVTDWSMPGMDGTQLVSRLRADPAPGYTYLVLLSGLAGEDAAREAARAGADEVLTKPLDAAALERGLIAAERLIAMHRRMTGDARRDPVTGAGSRLRLDEDLAALCARVRRYGHAYCMAMIGLEPGDEPSLRAAAAALERQIRSGDVLYRCGPASLVVLLPEQGLETANLAAERLRHAAQDALPEGARVSVGIVTTGAEPEPAALLAAAEAALAQAEQSGGIVGQSGDEGGALRLLVADDDPVSRLMLGAIVKREPGFELVGEAEDAGQAIELALRRRPDVVLLDVDMPGGGGARAAVEIREGLPAVRIVAISADDSQGSQYDMMRAGAVGFITKGAADDEILRVIRSSARW
jgi:two-component system chemotaxis response regulator CheY